MADQVLRTPFSRVFLTEDGASPSNTPSYLGFARAGSMDWGQGSLTPVRVPSPKQYGKFDIVDIIKGAPDLPSITIENRMTPVVSELMRIVAGGCAIDLQVHIGACQNPEDFDGGWTLIRVLEGAYPTGYSTSELGAIDADQDAVVTETLPLSGQRVYDLKHIKPQTVAASAVTDIINRVLICDRATCGECGLGSDGCQVMFALTGPVTGSPGLPSELLYSQDGGATWSSTHISTLSVAEEALDMACVGTNLVVVSVASSSLHYAPIADILDGSETWTEVTTGFIGAPVTIFSNGSSRTWIGAEDGYIYFTADPTAGVDVQTDGTVTTENILSIHGVDSQNLVAVGENNALLSTTNGGETWSLITGPAVGVVLNCVWMQSDSRWLVGTAGGKLFYTENSGSTWTEKKFSGSGAGQVRAISFSTASVGYMAHDTATPAGRMLRTINGGNSWVICPDESGVPVPTIRSMRSIAACEENPNFALVGGTATGGVDGYLARYA